MGQSELTCETFQARTQNSSDIITILLLGKKYVMKELGKENVLIFTE